MKSLITSKISKALCTVALVAVSLNATAAGEISGRNDRGNLLIQVVKAVEAGRKTVNIAANPGDIKALQIKVAIRSADGHYGNVVVKKVGVGKFKAKWLLNGNHIKRLTINLNGRGHK